MVSGAMYNLKTVTCLKGSLCHQFVIFVIWLSGFQDVISQHLPAGSSHTSELPASPPSDGGLFQPIEISPAVIPHYPFPSANLPPMYPNFPTTYNPVLTGKCPVNFSAMSNIMERTAFDCSQPLALHLGNAVCCPQFCSLLHIFQGFYSSGTNNLVLHDDVVEDCFTDVVSILAGRGANSSIPAICSIKSSNLTGGSCPVKDVTTFEKTVNTTKLLEACTTVDTLKECCRPNCQPAIMEAALHISGSQLPVSDNKNLVGIPKSFDALNDCKGVVYSWLSRKLSFDDANKAFRVLTSCKINKVCPLEFMHPSEVIKTCRNVAAPNPSCCSSVNAYVADLQKQMLITNRQAIVCATVFGSMLQKAGVLTDIYELCDVDLKDFSLQAYGDQGCLLRSYPADMAYDNTSGLSFLCDLNDNIAAPWPLSSSITSLSFCAPEMSLPALPQSPKFGNSGCKTRLDKIVGIHLYLVWWLLLFYY